MTKIIAQYQLGQRIERTQYCDVYRAFAIHSKKEVRMKVFKKTHSQNLRVYLDQVNQQILTWNHHPNIVKCLESLETTNNYYYAYEYCNGGNLQEFLCKKRQRMPLSECLIIFLKIIDAFKNLHTTGEFTHGDLKPSSIFFHNDIVKLSDIGFTTDLEKEQNMFSKRIIVFPPHLAPQIFKCEKYSNKADIWSIGVILYQLIFDKYPFQARSIAQLLIKVAKSEIQIPFPIAEEIETLLRRMLVGDPNKRISWTDLFAYEI